MKTILVDPEIKRALENIRRRQKYIDNKYGATEDDGPVFGRRKNLFKFEEEAFDDNEDIFSDV